MLPRTTLQYGDCVLAASWVCTLMIHMNFSQNLSFYLCYWTH